MSRKGVFVATVTGREPSSKQVTLRFYAQKGVLPSIFWG